MLPDGEGIRERERGTVGAVAAVMKKKHENQM